MINVGEILAGKYRVERLLGQGGMGVVIAARHLQLEERVAIKMMLADAASSPEAVARFLREARAAARLQSSHVARVSDVGTLEDGRAYMVIEYLDGADLSRVLEQRGPLPVGDAVDYVLQAAEAIAEAHSIGIVHRDLKPSNLFLTERRDRTPLIKVLDFGISKMSAGTGPASSSDHTMTGTSALMGSPVYMSPEQMTSARDVDGRTDIWALGVVLYELLAGKPPFMAETLPQICGLVLQGPFTPLSERRRDLPAPLEAAVRRCLEKRAADRYPSILQLALALQQFAGPHGQAAVERIILLSGGESSLRASMSVPIVSSAHTSVGNATHAAWGETKAPTGGRRGLVVGVVAVAAILAAGLVGMAALRNGSVQPTTSAAQAPPSAVPQTPPSASVAAPTLAPPPEETTATPPSAPAVAPLATSPAAPPSRVVAKRSASSPDMKKKPSQTSSKAEAPAATPAPAPAKPAAPVAEKPATKKPVDMGGRL